MVYHINRLDCDNQYWITTHSPTIARHLKNTTVGLLFNQEHQVEVVEPSSVELLSALTGYDAIIPISKTIVLLEGSTIPGQSLSLDENFFQELRDIGVISDQIQFVSVGQARSVEDLGIALPQFEEKLGLGWKVYSIRDRDAMSDEERKMTRNKNVILRNIYDLRKIFFKY